MPRAIRWRARFFKRLSTLLTAWLGNIVDLLDPDVLVMGGGVAAMLRPFFDDIKNRLPSGA